MLNRKVLSLKKESRKKTLFKKGKTNRMKKKNEQNEREKRIEGRKIHDKRKA